MIQEQLGIEDVGRQQIPGREADGLRREIALVVTGRAVPQPGHYAVDLLRRARGRARHGGEEPAAEAVRVPEEIVPVDAGPAALLQGGHHQLGPAGRVLRLARVLAGGQFLQRHGDVPQERRAGDQPGQPGEVRAALPVHLARQVAGDEGQGIALELPDEPQRLAGHGAGRLPLVQDRPLIDPGLRQGAVDGRGEPCADALAGRAVDHVRGEVGDAAAVPQQLRALHGRPVLGRHPIALEAAAQALVHGVPPLPQALAHVRRDQGGDAALLRILPPRLEVELEEDVRGAGDAARHAGIVSHAVVQPPEEPVQPGQGARGNLPSHVVVVAGQQRHHLVGERLEVGHALMPQRAGGGGEVRKRGQGDAAQAGDGLQRAECGGEPRRAGAAGDVRRAGDRRPLLRQEAAAGRLLELPDIVVALLPVAQPIREALHVLLKGRLRVRSPDTHHANRACRALGLAHQRGHKVPVTEGPVIGQPLICPPEVQHPILGEPAGQGARTVSARQGIDIPPAGDVVVPRDEVAVHVLQEAVRRGAVRQVNPRIGEGALVQQRRDGVAPPLEARLPQPVSAVRGTRHAAGQRLHPGASLVCISPDQRLHRHRRLGRCPQAGIRGGRDPRSAVQPCHLAGKVGLCFRGDLAQPGQHAGLLPARHHRAEIGFPGALLLCFGRERAALAGPLGGRDQVGEVLHRVHAVGIAGIARHPGQQGRLPGVALDRQRLLLLGRHLLRGLLPA